MAPQHVALPAGELEGHGRRGTGDGGRGTVGGQVALGTGGRGSRLACIRGGQPSSWIKGLGLHSTRLASSQVASRDAFTRRVSSRVKWRAEVSSRMHPRGPPLVLDQGRPPLARAAKAVRGAPVPPLPPGSKHPTLPHGMGRGQSPTPVVTLQTGVRTGVLTLRQDTRPDAGNGTRIFGFSPWMWRYGRGQPTRCLRPMPPLKRSAAAKSVTQSLRLSYPAPARRSRLHSDPARRGGRGGAPVRPPRAPSAGPGPTPAAAAASVAATDE